MKAKVFAAILEGVATHGNTRKAIRDATGAESRTEFYTHVRRSDAARQAYEEAKHHGLEALVDELVSIADEDKDDDAVKVRRAQVRVNVRQWLIERRLPAKYGSKVALTHANPDGTPLGFIALPAKNPVGTDTPPG